MLGVIGFILVLSFLIFVHELGHFIAAKLTGVWVQEFSIGMPPRIFSRQIGETRYSIGLLPIGGFVRLYGEEGSESGEIDESRAFFAKSNLQKLFILLAGVFMNFAIGVALMGIIFTTVGKPAPHYAVLLEEILPDSPAEAAGLVKGMYITGLKPDGQEEFFEVTTLEEFRTVVGGHLDTPLTLQIVRNQDDLETRANAEYTTVIPADYFDEQTGSLGVHIALVVFPIFEPVAWYAVPQEAVVESVRLVGLMLDGLRNLAANLARGIAPTDVAGPIGIAVISQEVVKQGWVSFAQFIALISMNLAVINVLPFPALDGGRVVFVLGEMIVGHRLSNKVQQWVHLVGIIVLLGLMAVITVYDVIRFL